MQPFVPDMLRHFRSIVRLNISGNNYTRLLEWPELLQDKLGLMHLFERNTSILLDKTIKSAELYIVTKELLPKLWSLIWGMPIEEMRVQFDYESDGTVLRTFTVYIDSSSLLFPASFNLKATSTTDAVIVLSPTGVAPSGLENGDFEFHKNHIAFGPEKMTLKSDGSGIVYTGTLFGSIDSVKG